MLKAHSILCPTVAVGSTPTCSNPAANLQGVNEIHPGNYIFYDLFQVIIAMLYHYKLSSILSVHYLMFKF